MCDEHRKKNPKIKTRKFEAFPENSSARNKQKIKI
jgi:hypothetical protein